MIQEGERGLEGCKAAWLAGCYRHTVQSCCLHLQRRRSQHVPWNDVQYIPRHWIARRNYILRDHYIHILISYVGYRGTSKEADLTYFHMLSVFGPNSIKTYCCIRTQCELAEIRMGCPLSTKWDIYRWPMSGKLVKRFTRGIKLRVKFTLEEATKNQKWSRHTAILFLQPRR